ncbi:non-ribosomal peptide synthetase [Leptolyngbya sp. FACHB-261]|uniref:non-ribosomal peptide synthetase n=1 Tax=Leptolyngbya sp. FACHB-261 TaxID=2692806 RepID=UPI0016839651|nr:non-ribosomal peptide synthetase [Leptolyngbya sp. FACHB-261]MBD2103129.1 amino acid adenylation domain-containing protein [Leptolyngbya sp. FACHB-261]
MTQFLSKHSFSALGNGSELLDSVERQEEVFVFPASFAQQRLWFLNQVAPGNPFYNMPAALRLSGSLNVAALHQVFNEIVRRHEVLRTSFTLVNEQLMQVVAPEVNLPLPVIDLQSLNSNEQEVQCQELAAAEAQSSFDLTQGPLLRLKLLRLGETEHLLLLTLHHIVSDEWSIGVLVQELEILYTAFANQQASPLPELPLQYADFACWQRQWLQGEILDDQLTYWRQQLSGLSALNLPTDRPRPATQTHRGASEILDLPQDLTAALEALSQKGGVTLFMTLLAAFQILLYRYTQQSDVAVGCPIANRNRSEIEGLIGFFVNSLVLRVDLAGNPSFEALLERVREVALGAYAHQDLPFEKLVEELQPERDLSRNPLFQVVFALQNAPMQALKLPGLTLSPLPLEVRTVRFDLEFLWEGSEALSGLWGRPSEGLRGMLIYSTDLFDASTIRRLLQNFKTLLESIVANPQQRLLELSLLTLAEQQQILIEWNNTQTDYPQESCVHHLFEAQVARTPDAVAVAFEDGQLTYQELNCRVNQLAHYLQRLGVAPEVPVGLCLEQSMQMVIGLLAILKAGGTYLPLDPSYPQERLKFMLQDARPSVLLTQNRWLEYLGRPEALVICLDNCTAIAQQDNGNLLSSVTAHNLAYILYTSGSTGQPKGVAIAHQAITRLVLNSNYIQLKASDRVVQAANTSFDAAIFEIWAALLHGAQLIGLRRETLLSPQTFAAQIRQRQISVLFLTTALFKQLASIVPEAFASVRCLLFGGEVTDSSWMQSVLESGSPQQLLHLYGPTEGTTFSSWYKLPESLSGASSIPIGQPVANTQIYILDTQLQLVPIGIPGEVYIGGDGLARGYLNQPELTAACFIPNPFSSVPGARLYRTGDLARCQPDGNLEFLGRLDTQVKVRGFRVEPAEIEAVLAQHPEVQAVVVMLRGDTSKSKQLVAYLVPNTVSKQGQTLTYPNLRHWLKEKLPEYMLPSALVVLEALPLTPNGKVDRRVLPAPASRQERQSEYVAPRTAIEVILVNLWAEVLEQKQIGIYDNFFELGGHSLLATQLISRVRNALGVEVPVLTLFEAPSVAGLANYVETVGWAFRGGQPDEAVAKTATEAREEIEF